MSVPPTNFSTICRGGCANRPSAGPWHKGSRGRISARFAALSFFTGLLAASGQPVQGEPEIRRALPVNTPAPTESPEWMDRVPSTASGGREIPVATPIPMARPVAVRTPAATPPPSVSPTPDVQPFRPTGRVEVAPQPDENGTIRIAPSSGQASDHAREALERANNFYSRKMYDLAVPEYEMFLISSNPGEGRDAALFRLAECHRMLGNIPSARSGYEKLVMEFQKGEFAGAGAYRLGEFLFGEKNYEAANTQFQNAARESKDGEVRLTALYFSARSLDYLKRDKEAREAYKAVLAVGGKNPYRDHARLASADIDARGGEKKGALAAYEELGTPGKTAMAAEAAVKGAALAVDLGQKEKAAALFEKAMGNPEAGDWKPVAIIGAMRLRYQASSYQAVVDMAAAADQLPAETRPEALQILAASYRQLGNNLDARRTYDRILKEFPDSAPSGDARFQRLVSLYALKDKNLAAEVDAFLEKTTNPKERTQALLLKAETWFKQGDYAGAGKVYEGLLRRELADELRADALYKLAWCLAATGDHPAAASVYSEFLTKFPDHKLASTALAQRALSKQENKAFDSAIADFDAIADKYPGTKEHELALQQKALIFGQQKNYPGMAQTFEKLLDKFPKSAAAAQANFWLGWAAFEQKNYKTAIPRLDAARTLDAAQYGERASLRIILSYYYMEDRGSVAREAANYKGGNLPAEITLWLASHLVDEGNYARAEALLLPLASNPAALTPDAWIQLGESEIRLGKFPEARGPIDKFLETARDPATRARGLMASAQIHLGMKNPAQAGPIVEEILLLQPEGRLNAEARLLQGDILLSQGTPEAAARAYRTVAVLLDDPVITPRALQKAADAYRRADNRFEAEKTLAELRQKYPDFQKSPKSPKTKS
ncbi:MAG: tetratricopeptide repeat protein [Terrimicrobiaceae bacterium]|nr:tetratricopeptide repeat protein [Terrimicrobiaceae bacterium]